jgi:hypothetical protein
MINTQDSIDYKFKDKLNDKIIIESTHEIRVPSVPLDTLFDKDYVHEYIDPPKSERIEGSITARELLEAEQAEKEKEKHKNALSETEEKIKYKQEYITKVKVIALDEMGKYPLDNPSFFTQKDKRLLIVGMNALLHLPMDVVNDKFNIICNESIFNAENKIESLPIYSA